MKSLILSSRSPAVLPVRIVRREARGYTRTPALQRSFVSLVRLSRWRRREGSMTWAEAELVMDDGGPTGGCARPRRPVRNRRYSRRAFVSGQRPAKRLFTPEIKRFLKEWLVRRRDNPYPDRDEKKLLANETGLTYVQICNWFANWRRKLKNASAERRRKTWGHLIKTYNDRAQGNVEQFSICSEDSIWGEDRLSLVSEDYEETECTRLSEADQADVIQQCYTISSTTEDPNNGSGSTARSKTSGSTDSSGDNGACRKSALSGALLLSKWLESAARFQPSEANYGWWGAGVRGRGAREAAPPAPPRHGRDEVEAAVALAALSATAHTTPL